MMSYAARLQERVAPRRAGRCERSACQCRTQRWSGRWSSSPIPTTSTSAPRGTIATWTDAGIEVSYCLITDGDAGGFDPDVPRSDIAGIRQAEQRAAAKELGVEDVVFLGYPDGRLTSTIELRRDISRVIRQRRPQRMLIQSPERNWERIYASHPDHLAAGEAAIAAVYPDARNPFAHLDLAAEGLEAWTVEELWVMAGRRRATTATSTSPTSSTASSPPCARTSRRPRTWTTSRSVMRGWGAMNAAAGGPARGPHRRGVPGARHPLMCHLAQQQGVSPNSCQR